MPKQKVEGNKEVQMDRRRQDRRTEAATTSANSESGSRKKQRRRQIDPTTCERDYNNEEIEFMHAMDAYKRSSGRMFPTCSEILEVIRHLGYVKLTEEQLANVVPTVVAIEEPKSDELVLA